MAEPERSHVLALGCRKGRDAPSMISRSSMAIEQAQRASPAGERILACIGPDPISPSVVRNAKRLSDLMNAPWLVVTVERPGHVLDQAGRQRSDDALKLAETLGAETTTLVGGDILSEVLRFAKFENVTQIVIGRSRGGLFAEIFRRSLPHELVRRSEDIAVHLVTGRAEGIQPIRRLRLR